MLIIATKKDVCQECSKHGPGVEFCIHDTPVTAVFMCWLHFRLVTSLLLQLGVVGPILARLTGGFNDGPGETALTVGRGRGRQSPRDASRATGVSHGISQGTSSGETGDTFRD